MVDTLYVVSFRWLDAPSDERTYHELHETELEARIAADKMLQEQTARAAAFDPKSTGQLEVTVSEFRHAETTFTGRA